MFRGNSCYYKNEMFENETMKYIGSKRSYVVLGILVIAVGLGIIAFIPDVSGKNKLNAIEKGDYSYIESDWTREVFEKRNPADFTWIYRDINGDGTEELIVQDDYAASSILFILSIEGNKVVTRFADLNDMGSYTQLCDNGLLYCDRYYGVYDYEQYILYRCDKDWYEIFVDGLELYYIDKPEEGVRSKGNGELDMKEAGFYFWNFQICDGERVYTKLTQEEWNKKFKDLSGKEYEGIIF